jgi:CheY-like chemotaxis protein
MDVQMPVLDGIGATRTLRGAGFDAPIVALTANVMAEDVQSYLGAGCTRCVGKPIDFDALARCLAELLGQDGAPDQCDSSLLDDVLEPAPFSMRQLSGFQQIARAFERGLPQRLDSLRASIDGADWDAVRELVHMLKGSAASFGYPRVTDLAREIEQALVAGDTSRAAELMTCLLQLDEVRQLQRQEEAL